VTPPLLPRMLATGGDAQQPTHRGNRIVGLLIAHELEPFGGIVSRENQRPALRGSAFKLELAILAPQPLERAPLSSEAIASTACALTGRSSF
jgi:hypothetical protein